MHIRRRALSSNKRRRLRAASPLETRRGKIRRWCCWLFFHLARLLCTNKAIHESSKRCHKEARTDGGGISLNGGGVGKNEEERQPLSGWTPPSSSNRGTLKRTEAFLPSPSIPPWPCSSWRRRWRRGTTRWRRVSFVQ